MVYKDQVVQGRYYCSDNKNILMFLFLYFWNSIPFSADEICSSSQEKEFSEVKPSEELLKNPDFLFLEEWRGFETSS